jgi:hypothetical protein
MVRIIQHDTLDSFFDACGVNVYSPLLAGGEVPMEGWDASEVFLACEVPFADADDVVTTIVKEGLGGPFGIALEPVAATWRTVLVAGLEPEARGGILKRMMEYGICVTVHQVANLLRKTLLEPAEATASALWTEVGDE